MNIGKSLTAVGSHTDAAPLSGPHEAFIGEFMSNGGNATFAYMVAYPHVTSKAVAGAAAARLRAMPDVAARIRELRSIAAQALNVEVAELALQAHELATASVHDLAPIEVYGCRMCHGKGGRYQWRDAEELCKAIDAYRASLNGPKPLTAPDGSGGFGYSSRAAVNPVCETCRGHGVAMPRILPTAELSAGARALYAGVQLNDDGTVERVLIEDRAKWAHMRNQLIGAYAPTKVEGKHAHVHLHKQAPDTRTPMTLEEAYAVMGVDDASIVSNQ